MYHLRSISWHELHECVFHTCSVLWGYMFLKKRFHLCLIYREKSHHLCPNRITTLYLNYTSSKTSKILSLSPSSTWPLQLNCIFHNFSLDSVKWLKNRHPCKTEDFSLNVWACQWTKQWNLYSTWTQRKPCFCEAQTQPKPLKRQISEASHVL